jgi:tetratricopeptide (TPR) repeat protein
MFRLKAVTGEMTGKRFLCAIVAMCIGAALVPLAAVFAQATNTAAMLKEAQELENRAGQLCRQAKFDEALPLAERALALYEQGLRDNQLLLATKLSAMATVYFVAGRRADAEPLLKRALAIREKALGPDHLDIAGSLDGLTLLYFELGRYADAEPLAKRALAIREKRLGPGHPAIAFSLYQLGVLCEDMHRQAEAESYYKRALAAREKTPAPNAPDSLPYVQKLGSLYVAAERYGEAEPLLKRALSIQEKALGPNHTAVADSLSDLGALYEEMRRYPEAETCYKRALAIREKALGPEQPDTATSLGCLATVCEEMGRYAQAAILAERALAIRQKALAPDSLDLAGGMNNLGWIYTNLGRFADAEPLYKRAIAIWEKKLGANDPTVATGLGNLSALYDDVGRYAEAEEVAQRALAIREKALGPEHRDTATSLNNLAVLYDNMGRYAEAEPVYRRALAIWEKTVGPNSPGVAACLNSLGTLYQETGRYDQAEAPVKRALAIREKISGPQHPDTATCLNNLGALYMNMSRDSDAEPPFKRAVAIYEKALGPNHPETATGLSNLASLYEDMGRYAEAEALEKRALAIREKALGPDHPDTATSLGNLAVLYCNTNRCDEAEPLLKRSLAIREKALGPNAPSVASSLDSLGALYQQAGRYSEAEPLVERALAIREKALGPEHPRVAATLVNRARLACAQGRLEAALADMQRAVQIENRLAERLFAISSPRQREGLAAQLDYTTSEALTLCSELMPDSPQARRLGLEVVLARKGWLMASELAEVRTVRLASDPHTARTFTQLQSVREQLAKLAFSIPPPAQEQAAKARWVDLETQQDALESELAHQSAESAGLTARTKADCKAVSEAIPDAAALVEFTAYQTFNFKATGAQPSWAGWKYAAYVLQPRSEDPICVPLGDAEKIDAAVHSLLRAKSLWEIIGTGADVYDFVCRPLEKHLDGVNRVILAPDGELAEIPFGVLPSSAGPTFLCEKHILQLVNSGRDLVSVESPATSGAVLVGDPDFKSCAPASPGKPATTAIAKAATTTALVREMRGLPNSARLTPLPQTRTEVEQIAHRLREAGESTRVLLGDEATKSALKAMTAPRYLHLATHGFFLPDSPPQPPAVPSKPVTRGGGAPVLQPTALLLHDPMHRSGLALAGAQRLLNGESIPQGQDDGVLTAGEVASLNLQGTRLVVLSACDTGLGEVRRGEGVMGLRRSFATAGAQAVMMSLWEVPDEPTRQLMVSFYDHYLTTADPALALAQAQREALAAQRAAKRIEPWKWGAFVVCGAPSR